MFTLQARVRQDCDRSYMDSTSPIATANRFATRTYVDASLTNVTERFYENNNVENSRSPYGWKKRVGISDRRRWPSTFSPDVSEVVSLVLSSINLAKLSNEIKNDSFAFSSNLANLSTTEKFVWREEWRKLNVGRTLKIPLRFEIISARWRKITKGSTLYSLFYINRNDICVKETLLLCYSILSPDREVATN